MAAFQPKLYQWEGCKYSVPAQVVGDVCEKLESEYGEVTRQNFLDASRDETAPTHSLFEWNDSIAAESWRLEQSRRVLHCLKITIIKPDESEAKQRAYINVNPVDSDGSYRSFKIAMEDANLRENVLARALRELEIFQAKYSNLEELAKVFNAIKIVTAEISGGES